MIIGKPRRRSSAGFLRVARRCASDATRASGDILLSGIGFKPLYRFFFMEGEERSQLNNIVSGGFRQQLCRRRRVIPGKPFVRQWRVIIEQMLSASRKSSPNVFRRNIVSAFDHSLANSTDGFADVRDLDEMQLDGVAVFSRIFENVRVRSAAERRFKRKRFASIY